MRTITLSFMSAAALVLSGCATTFPNQPLSPAVQSEVETIRVLPMRESEVSLRVFNHTGYSFGLIGAVIVEMDMSRKQSWLQEQVEANGFDHVSLFKGDFDKHMEDQGYEVIWPETVMETDDSEVRRSRWGFRRQYGTMPEDADAVLDMNFGFVGYAAAGSGSGAPYRPTAVVMFRLIDREGREVLGSEQVIYNNVFNSPEAITLEPDGHFVYEDFDALEKAEDDALEGLHLAMQEAARASAELFAP